MVAIGAVWLIGQAIPLGWDESVYASKSRSLLTDIPSSTWAIYRAPGLPVVGLLGGAFGFTDANLRAVAVVLNLGALAMAWAFARVLWGPLAAIVALLTIVGSPVVIAEIALFHTDLPSAGLLLALMLLVWYEFERRPEPSRLLIAAAPLAALAFYVRYGSILPIGGIGIAAVVLWHRSMLRNKGLVGLTVALAALLFAPHILEAISRTGSPLGIITSAGEQVDTSEPIATAARYLGWLPSQLAHRLGFVVMLAGVVHAAIVAFDAIRRRELGPVARRYLWLFVPAGVTTVGLIVQSHAEQRYVLFPVLLAIIAGAGAVSAAVAWLRTRPASRRPATGRRRGDRRRHPPCRRRRGIGRGAPRWSSSSARATNRDGSPPSDEPSRRTRTARASWPPRSRRSSSGTRDARPARSPPAARRFWERVAPSSRRTSSSRTSIERRASPATIQRYRALLEVLKANGIPIYGVEPGVEVDRLTR